MAWKSGSWPVKKIDPAPAGPTDRTRAAAAVPVGPPLLQRLSGACPEAAEHLAGLSCTANVEASLGYRPGATRPWGYDVTLTLAGGRFGHRALPLPLEALEVSLRCTDGHIPRVELRARSGSATLTAVARDVTLPWGCESPAASEADRNVCPTSLAGLLEDIDVTAENVPVSESLFDSPLLAPHKDIYHLYQPDGPVGVTFQARPEGKQPWRRRLLLEPRGMKGTFAKFIYTLERVTGSVELRTGGPRGDVWAADLTGYAGQRPVRVKGEVRGSAPHHTLDIDVRGEDIPMPDDKILFALRKLSEGKETDLEKVARSFDPTGLLDFHVHVHRPPGVPKDTYANRVTLRFREATARLDRFRYLLENVSGVLEIRPDQSWEFRDFRGTHGGAVVTARGHSRRREDGAHVTLAGRNVALDADLRAALDRDLQTTWDVFRPEGALDFDGTVYLPPGRDAKPEIDVTVRPRAATAFPRFFPYRLTDLYATLHYARNAVRLEGLTGRHGPTGVRIDRGLVVLRPGGGFTADLTNLHAEGLHADDDLLRALREVKDVLARGAAALEIQGPLDLHTRLYVDVAAAKEPPRVFWDGSVALRDAAVRTGVRLEHVTGVVAARGWYNGSRIEAVDGNLDVKELSVFGQRLQQLRGGFQLTDDEPDVLKVPGLMASYLGGQVYGPVRVEFGARPRYELNLTAAQVRLEEFARHNFHDRKEVPELHGPAVARLYLRGEGGDVAGLRGGGRIDVPSGKMANLHPLVDLLKFLGLRMPDRTMFEEAHAAFDIEGPRARVRQLDLFGNVISLRGRGEVNLDGSDVALDFNVDWARLGQVLPPGVRAVPREISNQLLKIEARGRLDDLRFTRQPVPLVTEPLRRLLLTD